MEKRETFKDVTFGGRKWRIGRFDALTGSYIAYKILTQILPMGIEAQMGNLSLPKDRGAMSKEEFTSLQKDCLMICSELQLVGTVETPFPVMTTGGGWESRD